MKKIILVTFLLLNSSIWSQDYRFGKVSKAELEEKFYPLDSTANAVVLYSERKTYFEFGNGMIDEYYERIKIYSEEGYKKATKRILLFRTYSGSEEEILSLKANTYNIIDNKIVKTKLTRDNIFVEKLSKYTDYKVFTMPNLKPGSIIEWKYSKKAFVNRLQEVILQDDIPIKKLKVYTAFPDFYKYSTRIKGYLPVNIKKETKEKTAIFGYKADFMYQQNVNIVEKINIPAIKKEPYSGNIDNYKSGIIYELSIIKNPNGHIINYATNWEKIVEQIYENSHFGEQIEKNKHFEDELNELLSGVDVRSEKVFKIFQFVKEKIKWNGYNGKYSPDGIKKAYNKGLGNVADINLSLIAMLKSVGLDATPVLVSTKNHGIPLFPTRYGLNYVIAMVITPMGNILLDATEKNAAPNVLPDRVLNFRGLAIYNNGASEWIDLFPNDHAINKTTIKAKFDGLGFKGVGRSAITNKYLLKYRNDIEDKKNEELIEWIDENKNDIEVKNARVSNISKLDKDIMETIQFETDSYFEEIADKTYISPLLYTQLTENPFKSEKREFPVFYNTPWATMSVINLSIPETYTIENIPEAIEYVLPNEMGVFNYSILLEGQNIQIQSILAINLPVIPTNHYQDLKEFYKKVIAKQNEKIVLSKK